MTKRFIAIVLRCFRKNHIPASTGLLDSATVTYGVAVIFSRGTRMSIRHLSPVAAALAGLLIAASAFSQPPGGFGGPRPEPEIPGIPRVPTAVALPTLSAPITGPGAMFDSAPSQAKGLDQAHYRYETTEYFVSGTATASHTRAVSSCGCRRMTTTSAASCSQNRCT
jgi:hypothetical protein